MILSYYVVDVFTTERYKGNPLAVVYLEEALALTDYQKIAKVFGYSETSFINFLSQTDPITVRSFTPAGIEVNGAGHNLLGAASLILYHNPMIFSRQQPEPYVMMANNRIRLSIAFDDRIPVVEMLQKPARAFRKVPAEKLAPALSLLPDDLLSGEWQATVVATEVAHLMIPVWDLDRLNQAMSNKPLLAQLAREFEFQGCYVFAFTPEDPTSIAQCRFFNPDIGIDEDAATGSAAGPLAGWLHQQKYLEKNEEYFLSQGVKMGQPSTIRVRISDQGVWVGGSSVIVMEGKLHL